MHDVIMYSHGNKAFFFPFVHFGHFSICRGAFANFKVPTNYEMRLLPRLRSCQLAAYGNAFKEKSWIFKARPIKGCETQHNLNCDHLAQPWNKQWLRYWPFKGASNYSGGTLDMSREVGEKPPICIMGFFFGI